MAALTGQELQGYIIGNLISSGGMGEVYQGFKADNVTERVAIKIIRPDYGADPDYTARFIREIRLMKLLDHPHIIPIYGYGEANGYLYFVMKMIKGITLRALLESQHFTPVSAWEIISPIAQALDYGHSQGVIHRDIKPGNVLLERHDHHYEVYLSDFGLGKKLGDEDGVTKTGDKLGTPDYMAPEAVIGQQVDHRADIYSFGCMIYQLLLGELPYRKRAPHLIAIAHLREKPREPISLRPDFPLALQQVLIKSLARQPEDRQPTIKAFTSELYEAIQQLDPEQRTTDYWISE